MEVGGDLVSDDNAGVAAGNAKHHDNWRWVLYTVTRRLLYVLASINTMLTAP
jgi:hypothetical protein